MFKIKAETTILVYAPFGIVNAKNGSSNEDGTATYYDHAAWKAYLTKEDRIYEKEEVYDVVRTHNNRDDIPFWIRLHVESGKVVVHHAGVWALVNHFEIEYLD